MSLHSPIALTGTGRLATASYAWSAQTAYFSWVATEAEYALYVTGSTSQGESEGGDDDGRIISPPSASKMEEARMEMNASVKIFQRHEEESARVGGQDADSASYAGLSDVATYAVYAERAMYVL